MHRLLLCSLLCMLAAISHIGYNYYPHLANAMVPELGGYIACILAIGIGATLFQNHSNCEKTPDSIPLGESGDSGRGQQKFLVTLTDVLSTRAIFSAGFALSTCTRYAGDGSWMGLAYLYFSVLAVSLALICTFTSSVIVALMFDLQTSSQRAQFATEVVWAEKLLSHCFFGSFAAMMCTVGCSGWGTGFEYNISVPAIWCSVGLTVVGAGIFQLRNVAVSSASLAPGVSAMVDEIPVDPNADEVKVKGTETAPKKKATLSDRMLSKANLVGLHGTIISGFVMIAVVTYHSDVELLADNFDFVQGQQGTNYWPAAFVYSMSLTLSLGMITAMLGTMYSVTLISLPNETAKVDFIQRTEAVSSGFITTYYFCVFTFIFGFGLLGRAKFDIPLPPESTAALCLSFFCCGAVWIRRCGVDAKTARLGDPQFEETVFTRGTGGSRRSRRRKRTSTMKDNEAQTPLAQVIRDQIGAASGAAIFIGGFAYLAVNFFRSPSADGATMYLWLMGLVFGLCMICCAFGSFIFLEVEGMENEIQEEAFAVKVFPVSRMTFVFLTLAMLLLFQGLIHMGHTKRLWYVHVTEIAVRKRPSFCVMPAPLLTIRCTSSQGWLGFFGVFLLAWTMPLLAHKAMLDYQTNSTTTAAEV
jgi:hypothetical protein